ncbi:hypothetical protein SAMN04487928_11933 [Butyrivibrio proteoclasticus]|uniref:Uncharacterized protein n=1 Tax=Butyrivibrio proteoclasticus TaxID=43305 RepID=A0A1I5VVB1_9FIRM|nr:hypothetical protein SAMN04487928_11933 [Butyrivibrio proteoclasticus]
MSISLDVLYHLVEPNVYENYMNNLFGSSNKWVGIYSYDGKLDLPMASHVLYREHNDYIKEHFKNFRLVEIIKNQYKRTLSSDPETTSWCDFFFYESV